MSTISRQAPREYILKTFQEISGLNIGDCIQCLDQYDWRLNDIVEDFLKGKDLKAKQNIRTNQKEERDFHKKSSVTYSNPNAWHTAQKQTPSKNEDDIYYAELLQRYGDTDELVRRDLRESRSDFFYSEAPKQSYHEIKDKDGNIHTIYHEKQEHQRCGIHSLNNLFQKPDLFTYQQLDTIVKEFDARHKNNEYGQIWMGNYDLRVLIEAVKRRGYLVQQINYLKRTLESYPWDSYFGLLINLNGAHWFAIKSINGFYYNLDSTFSKPLQIGYKNALTCYLIGLIEKFQSLYIFVVVGQWNSAETI